jgi:hypothetical protein
MSRFLFNNRTAGVNHEVFSGAESDLPTRAWVATRHASAVCHKIYGVMLCSGFESGARSLMIFQ